MTSVDDTDQKRREKKGTLPCSAYLTLLRFLKPLVKRFCAVSMTIL